MQDTTLFKSFIIEVEYFRLQGLLEMLVNECFPDGTLLQSQHKKILNQFYHEISQRWKLIYKGSRDGFHADAFHSRCNNKRATVTIIQSDQNFIFRGYTSVSWISNDGCKTDPSAFLFTLRNPHNIPPTKYSIKSDKEDEAICHNSSYGPRFGKGADISVRNGGTSRHSQYTNFPTTNSDTGVVELKIQSHPHPHRQEDHSGVQYLEGVCLFYSKTDSHRTHAHTHIV
ncbi:unnamed protein product [Rotaria magnacalcarata]|uniref:TLDc domain-containing protein n=3 Tax=Rotaria magnacalcarata TaxID=392030 RepID=A0A816DCM2_9BILA|nr:unnamed protein product [Rotaria magnacalcarata]